ncbi:C_GCAxxG_C_C family protein [Candidatus Bipolaricaulota bacterium]|nr:C_GCAxxG_C_C family protein [Candidatus Bipolaricaulota bacterium]
MKQTVQRSRELFDSGFYCAESVLMAVAESRAVSCKLIPGIASGFCSGQARTGGPCGALAGAILAVNMVLGRCTSKQSIEPCYQAVRTLAAAFARRFGADNCEALIGCHLGTEEGQAYFRENGLESRCRDMVGVATELALEAIAETPPPIAGC